MQQLNKSCNSTLEIHQIGTYCQKWSRTFDRGQTGDLVVHKRTSTCCSQSKDVGGWCFVKRIVPIHCICLSVRYALVQKVWQNTMSVRFFESVPEVMAAHSMCLSTMWARLREGSLLSGPPYMQKTFIHGIAEPRLLSEQGMITISFFLPWHYRYFRCSGIKGSPHMEQWTLSSARQWDFVMK